MHVASVAQLGQGRPQESQELVLGGEQVGIPASCVSALFVPVGKGGDPLTHGSRIPGRHAG